MKKRQLFQSSFLVKGIMCFKDCGSMLQTMLNGSIDEAIEKNLLPADASLIIHPEPQGLGLHHLLLSVESDDAEFQPAQDFDDRLKEKLKENIPFDIIEPEAIETTAIEDKKQNRHMLINLCSVAVIIALSLLFPPSLWLSIGLSTLTFASTAYTSREYLWGFYQNCRSLSFNNMRTTVSLGWILSMAHMIFHIITMPVLGSFSMIFMNFIMPPLLITCINGMDSLKAWLGRQSIRMQLQGIHGLFPEMDENYPCYHLSPEELGRVANLEAAEKLTFLQKRLEKKGSQDEKRNRLNKNMMITVRSGACFPVDGLLVDPDTRIDAAILTGEPQQKKQAGDEIPAGAINLGPPVIVFAKENSYNSTINRLLFRANRDRNKQEDEKIPSFAYLYTALIISGMIGACLFPALFGIASVALILQNIIGILFSICPCTLAIAHELPSLLSLHHRQKKGIRLREADLIQPSQNPIHTVVFDKTGTLTTGQSQVAFSTIGHNPGLWQRIYLAEKQAGRGHPLAKAIIRYYEARSQQNILFHDIQAAESDGQHRGLKAEVQGKTLLIGSAEFLREAGVQIADEKIPPRYRACSRITVAEDGVYQGSIYVAHEIRPGVIENLRALKKNGKTLIMLSGDTQAAALAFNAQLGHVFENDEVHGGQTPEMKERFLEHLALDPKGLWFVGDGLNDAPCCRLVSEKGGIAASMHAEDKSAFFSDLSLNGRLDYLSKHHELNQSLKNIIRQNQGILIYSTLVFLASMLCFSIAGIALSPFIPMAIMVSSTLFVLVNSYRSKLCVDKALDKAQSWPKAFLGSDASIGLLMSASTLILAALFIATLSSGGLALPLFSFSAGIAMACSSICSLTAFTALGIFAGVFAAALWEDETPERSDKFTTIDSFALLSNDLPIDNAENSISGQELGRVFEQAKGTVSQPEEEDPQLAAMVSGFF